MYDFFQEKEKLNKDKIIKVLSDASDASGEPYLLGVLREYDCYGLVELSFSQLYEYAKNKKIMM